MFTKIWITQWIKRYSKIIHTVLWLKSVDKYSYTQSVENDVDNINGLK